MVLTSFFFFDIELADILSTPTNQALLSSIDTLTTEITNLRSVLLGQQTEADSATTTAGQLTEMKMMDETEINNKRMELKKLWAIYIRRTKLVSNSKDFLLFFGGGCCCCLLSP